MTTGDYLFFPSLFGVNYHLMSPVHTSPPSCNGARTAGTKIALRFPRLFVCLFVCLFVRPHLSRAQYITSYVTMQLQAAFGGLQAKLQQMKVVLCCLDGENVVGSREDPGFLA